MGCSGAGAGGTLPVGHSRSAAAQQPPIVRSVLVLNARPTHIGRAHRFLESSRQSLSHGQAEISQQLDKLASAPDRPLLGSSCPTDVSLMPSAGALSSFRAGSLSFARPATLDNALPVAMFSSPQDWNSGNSSRCSPALLSLRTVARKSLPLLSAGLTPLGVRLLKRYLSRRI